MENNIYNIINKHLDCKKMPKVIKNLILSYSRPIHPIAKIYKESLFYILHKNYEFKPKRLLEPIIDENYFTIVGLLNSLEYLPNETYNPIRWKIYV